MVGMLSYLCTLPRSSLQDLNPKLKRLKVWLQGHLTPEQEQALSALRARFPESAVFHSDYDLLRYVPCCVPDLLVRGTGRAAA